MDITNFLISNGRGTGASYESLVIRFSARAITATENNQTNSWNVNFNDGNTWNNNKYNGNVVRAVAALDEEAKIGWLEAYSDCCRNKKSSPECCNYRMRYEMDLWNLIYEVYSRAYKPIASSCFVVTRPKLREVFAASFRDRIVHHWICLRLNPLFEERFNEHGNVSHNCRAGYGTLSAVKKLSEDIRVVSHNYTRKAYVGKFDIKAFFMSVEPSILWNRLKPFIVEKYNGPEKNTLLYLVEVVLLYRPQENCVMKSPKRLHEALPKGKSLFDSDTGLPIGNLPSQLFANFFMSYLDSEMVSMRKMLGDDVFRYERYVDDFCIVCECKEVITAMRDAISEAMWRDMKLELHKNKFYIQEASKGVNFVGSVIKNERIYLLNRTIYGLLLKLYDINNIARVLVEGNVSTGMLRRLEKAVSSANSYLGFTTHNRSYNIRRKAFDGIGKYFWNVCYVRKDDLACVYIRRRYRIKIHLIEKERIEYGMVLRKRKAKKHRSKKSLLPKAEDNKLQRVRG